MSLKCRPYMAPSGVPRLRPPMPPCPGRPRLPVMTVNGEKPDANGDLKIDLSAIDELKDRVAGLDEAVNAETQRATGAEEALSGRITDEVQAREQLATDVQGNAEDIAKNATAITGLGASKADKATTYTKEEVDAAVAAATPADYDSVKTRLATVEGKIPSHASAQNQLADKEFVNSSIATNTATFRGTYNLASDLGLTTGATHEQVAAAVAVKLAALSITPDPNDYCFVQVPRDDTDPTVIDRIDRYKCSVEGDVASWDYEWSLNNSSFTAVQWAAINSGITSGLVAKLGALPTAEALAAALAGKASTADATLTPIYNEYHDTPTFSEWVTDVGSFPNIEWDDGNGCWKVYTSGGNWFTPQYGGHDYYAISLYDGAQVFTATRNRTDIIGYQLGDQTDKPLQPKGNYAPATNIAKSALAQNVQASLDKADTALQTAPVTSVNNKTGAVSLSASDVDALPLTGGELSGDLLVSGRLNISAFFSLARWAGSSLLFTGNIENVQHRALLSLVDASNSPSFSTIAFLQNLAPNYDATSTYELNNLCVYISKLYRCTTAITKAEAWNSSKWTAATVQDVLAAIWTALADKAPLVSPAFTGTPTAPTPTAQSADTQIATKKYVDDAVAGGGGGNLDYVMRVDPETGGIYYTTPDTNA